MNKLFRFLSVIITLSIAGFAQVPVSVTPYQVLDARTGQAIACSGCSIYTYIAGTTTPLATYTDSTLVTANTNPVVTNAAGYASNGSTITGIWVSGNPGSSCYKFVLKDSSGVTIWTQDNICTNGAILQLPLYGLNIQQNTNSPQNGGYIDLKPITYNPYNGSPCVDYGGNPVQQPLPASGLGAGTSTGFGNNDLLMWNGTSPIMPANGSCGVPLPVNTLYGINTNGYFYARAGHATDLNMYNSMQSLFGGVTAGSFTAGVLYPAGTATLCCGNLGVATYLGGHVDTGHSTGPPVTACTLIASCANPLTGGEGLVAGMIYYDDGAHCEEVYSGTAWSCIGGSGGSGGTPGGSTTQVQYNNAGAFGGSANYTWNNGSQLLTVTGTSGSAAAIAIVSGFVQSAGGFVVVTTNAYNSVQTTATGGMAGRSFTATKYIQSGNNSGVPTVTTSDSFNAGAMYYDTGNACEEVYSGSTWSCLAGGSGTPGGSNTDVQINSSGSFGGSANLTFASQTLTVAASSSSNASIYAKTGFVQSDVGFVGLSTATAYNAFQAGSGGMQALSFTAANYVQTGNGTTNPTPTTSDTFHAGAMYYNTISSCEEVYSGATWACIGGGSGTPGGSNTDVQFNNSGAFGGSANFTWNNSNATLNVAYVGGSSGVVSPLFNANVSGLSGSAKTFQNSDGSFTVSYLGAIAGISAAIGTGSPFTVSAAGNVSTSGTLAVTGVVSGTHLQGLGSGDSPSFAAVTATTLTGTTVNAGSGGLVVNSSWGLNAAGGLTISSCSGCPGSSYSAGTGITISGFVISIGQAVATSSNVTFASLATTGVVNGGSFQNNSGSFTMSGGGAGAMQSIAVGSGSPFTVNTSGNIATSGTLSGTHLQNLGTADNVTHLNLTATSTFNVGTNNGSTATGGGGAQISNSTSNVSLYGYDTGGVCSISSATPGVACSSDERLKKNITSILSGLVLVQNLRPVEFDWRGSGSHTVGFIAQEVRRVLPGLVTEKDGYLMLSEEGIIPYLVKAIQEQQAEIDNLRRSIK